MIKFCVQCGRRFEPHHGLETLCSTECRYARHKKAYRLFYHNHKEPCKMRRCIICGREFQPPTNHRNRRTCSAECRYQHKLQYDREYDRSRKVEIWRSLLDYLARLEKTYGELPNGRIKRLILDWYER